MSHPCARQVAISVRVVVRAARLGLVTVGATFEAVVVIAPLGPLIWCR